VRKQVKEEAMKWSKNQSKKGSNYDQALFLLINQAHEVVKDTIQSFSKSVPSEQSKLPKVESELFYFFLFAPDYWWQTGSSEKQKRIWEKAFGYHLDLLCGDDEQGWAMRDTLRQRFIAYGQIVNEHKDNSAKFFDFSMRLEEYSGVPTVHFFGLIPSLFLTALKSVSALKVDKRGLVEER
jgi:hypothetical protein